MFGLGLSLGKAAVAIDLIYLAVYGAGAFRLGRCDRVDATQRPNRCFGRGPQWMDSVLGLPNVDSLLDRLRLVALDMVGAAACHEAAIRSMAIPARRLVPVSAPDSGASDMNLMAAVVTAWLVLRTIFASHRLRCGDIRPLWRLDGSPGDCSSVGTSCRNCGRSGSHGYWDWHWRRRRSSC